MAGVLEKMGQLKGLSGQESRPTLFSPVPRDIPASIPQHPRRNIFEMWRTIFLPVGCANFGKSFGRCQNVRCLIWWVGRRRNGGGGSVGKGGSVEGIWWEGSAFRHLS